MCFGNASPVYGTRRFGSRSSPSHPPGGRRPWVAGVLRRCGKAHRMMFAGPGYGGLGVFAYPQQATGLAPGSVPRPLLVNPPAAHPPPKEGQHARTFVGHRSLQPSASYGHDAGWPRRPRGPAPGPARDHLGGVDVVVGGVPVSGADGKALGERLDHPLPAPGAGLGGPPGAHGDHYPTSFPGHAGKHLVTQGANSALGPPIG